MIPRKKKVISFTLDAATLDKIDSVARILEPDKPNRSRALITMVDYINGNATYDMIKLHYSIMSIPDGRKNNSEY